MPVTYDFAKQTAIVTGGARGIGRAIAGQLAASGADVWIWAIDPVEIAGTRSVAVAVDVATRDSIAQALTLIKGKDASVLDVAAGSGVWGITLAKSARGVRVTAVEGARLAAAQSGCRRLSAAI